MRIRFISITFTILLSCLFISCKKEVSPIVGEEEEKPIVVKVPTIADLTLLEVNKYRSTGCNCGSEYFPPVDTLSLNDTLSLAAKDHSMDMEQNDFFNHEGSDGSRVSDRVNRYFYSWSHLGENIAKGSKLVVPIVEAWIKSTGHCKNIMNANFTEMGVGQSGEYWTLVLARPFSHTQ